MLLKLSVRSVGSEFQIVRVAWQKKVVAPASWSRQWLLEWRWRMTVTVHTDLFFPYYFFLIKVPAHYSTPASAALAEGSRADCIQEQSAWCCHFCTFRSCLPVSAQNPPV